jgi:SSS family solute:Na+ symporter
MLAAVAVHEIIIVVLYLMFIGYLGYLGFRRTRSATDYLLAGRQTHPFVMAMSYGATFISTSAIVGFGGVAGMFGMSLLWLTFLNIFVGIFIAFALLGGPTRKMGHRLDAHTFPELIGRRYKSRALQILAGVIIFLFIPLYAAAVLIGGCEFIDTQFGIGYEVALLVFSVLIAAYVVVGGLKGVMYTDALQGTIMFVGMVILLIGTYVMLGGITEAHQKLTDIGDDPNMFAKIGFTNWTAMPEFGWGAKPGAEKPNPAGYNLWWIVISTITLGVGIGVLAQPQLAVRFMTVKSKRELNRAVLVGGVFIMIMTGVAFTVGSLSNVYFKRIEQIEGTLVKVSLDEKVVVKDERDLVKALPVELLHIDTDADEQVDETIIFRGKGPVAPICPDAQIQGLEDPGQVESLVGQTIVVKPRANSFLRSLVRDSEGRYKANSDKIIPLYISKAMPSWFGLVFLLTLLAAAMSTLSSQFHALGTAIGRDVYEQATGKHGQAVLVTRIGIVLGIIAAVIISYNARGGYIIARATAIFFGLCGSAFLPAYVGGLFFRRATRIGALSSMVVGFAVTAFWLGFIKDKEARALGICKALTGKHSLLLEHPNWPVVDPILVALPASILVFVVVSLLTCPPNEAHLERCFASKPTSGAED